jgi:purine-nucleoside/S-methyl-5'-thioadenosine phosphorylase / adenosine deaminase
MRTTDVNADALPETHAETVPLLQAWDAPARSHGFFSRLGGVSSGAFATLNLSRWVGDDPAAVDENWRRVRPIIGESSVVASVNQVHGAAVRLVTRANASERPRADGMVTAESGIVLAIFTADCVPILMHDPLRRIVGALHAGWRGILAGIVEAGIDAMRSRGADAQDLRVALGPSIGACCFEVDADLAARFARRMPGAVGRTCEGRPGKAYLDLRGIVRLQLVRFGVDAAHIAIVGPCTRCASDRYFSRRGAGNSTTGLQMSFIGLAPE